MQPPSELYAQEAACEVLQLLSVLVNSFDNDQAQGAMIEGLIRKHEQELQEDGPLSNFVTRKCIREGQALMSEVRKRTETSLRSIGTCLASGRWVHYPVGG